MRINLINKSTLDVNMKHFEVFEFIPFLSEFIDSTNWVWFWANAEEKR